MKQTVVRLPVFTGYMTKCCQTAQSFEEDTVTEQFSNYRCIGCSKPDPQMIEYTPERHGHTNNN
jgi:hypothetical protein